METTITLYNDDCFNILPRLKGTKIDLVLFDPPYGQTPLEWDKSLNFERLWTNLNDVCRKNCPIVVFAQEPFASKLRLSNITNYKYDWYWKKERPTNIFQVKRRPGKYIENICVFYGEQCNFTPIKVPYDGKPVKNSPKGCSSTSISGNNLKVTPYVDDGTRYPCEILEFKRDVQTSHIHPTQKPVALLEYLIKTYTSENDTVLDITMGSGSTGVACLKTNRHFIGIELDEEYFRLAKDRIESTRKQEKRKLF